MSKNNDSFFNMPPDQKLTDKILKNAQLELEMNKKRHLRTRIMVFFAPVITAVAASFFAFKINTHKDDLNSDQVDLAQNAEQIEMISDLIEDQETLDMVDELSLLEDFEDLEHVNDEDLEEG